MNDNLEYDTNESYKVDLITTVRRVTSRKSNSCQDDRFSFCHLV